MPLRLLPVSLFPFLPSLPVIYLSKARDFLVMEGGDVSPFDVIDSALLLRHREGERGRGG